ncbi:polyprenol monophosphomannose synthase [Adhaeretor mobilis]|uniref:Undecaprenyl-phosphate mannosyltransferase n=1 Tax=Adhaeretor mobilis TaxID=1930276 RepID=A0A517MSQ5_9BACT|nr:polyprenol monophosphomannose synthase [Adhaeretor mobilis]QDS97918.1 Undecaprenyl-phosphate mannosyltransferase [Adhaeretor mobilis]
MLVAICTYNERENLPTLVEAIREELPAADLLIVDDNSPDGTGQWCDELAQREPWFTCLHRAGKLGLGSASWLALQSAVELNYDTIITMDADWSHPPAALTQMLAAGKDADVVIGSRYCPGGKIDGWPISRYLMSRTVNFATRLALGLPARDCSTAYRLYRVEALRKLDFTQLKATGYAYLEEILWQLSRQGATIAEVPITFSERRAGASKVTFSEALGKAKTLASLARRRVVGS